MPGLKCGACSKFMSLADGVKCNKCNTSYHRLCVSLPQASPTVSTWRCPECKRKMKRDETSTDELSSPANELVTQETVANIGQELSRIRNELCSVREEFRAFRAEIAELRTLSTRVDSLENRIELLEQSANNQAKMCSTEFDEVVTQLKLDLNERDQQLLANDIEIANIPEANSENLLHTMGLIATKLGVALDDRDIVSIHRAGGRHLNVTDSSGPTETRPRTVVVRLVRSELRTTLLRAARARRGADTSGLNVPGQPKRFYINERLTKRNRVLFRQAREAGHRCGWKFIWTNRGRIFARKTPGDDACPIRSEADITRMFGPGAGTQNKTTK